MALPVYIPKTFEEYRTKQIAYLAARSSKLTNFKPGSRARTLVEALSIELAAADSDYAEFWKYAVRESCFQSFGFPLKDGNLSTGQVRVFHTGHLVDFVIPAFTIELFGLTFVSEDSPPVIPVAQTFIDVNIAAADPGTEYDIEAGAIDTDLGQGDIEPDFPVQFDRITNLTETSGGTDQETEAEREERFQEFINNLARSTLSGIRAGALTVNGVVDAAVTENVNPFTLLAEPGWVIISITDGTGSPPAPLLAEVKKVVDGDPTDPANYPGYRAAGVQSHVQAIGILAANLTIDIDIVDTTVLTDPEIETLIGAAISNYVNRLTAGQDVILRQVEATAIFANRSEVIRATVTAPGGDIVVSATEIPKIGGTGGGTLTFGTISRIPFP